FERSKIVVPLTRMGDQDRRVFLEDCRDRHHWDVLAYKVERAKRVRGKVKVQPPGGKQLGMIDLRSALAQRDRKPMPAVYPGGDRLVVAAMLGFGPPVGAEGDRLRRRIATEPEGSRGANNRTEQNAHASPLSPAVL